MYYELYTLVVVLGAGAAAGGWLVRPTRPVLPMVGSGLWTIATLQARNLEVISNGSRLSVDGGQAWQLVCLAIALLQLATVILWYLGVYPPTEERDDVGSADIPDQAATMEAEQ
jgi:hypothetical protein